MDSDKLTIALPPVLEKPTPKPRDGGLDFTASRVNNMERSRRHGSHPVKQGSQVANLLVSFRLPISTRSWGISQGGDGRRYPSLRFVRRRRGAARRDIRRSGPQPRSRETPDRGADEASRRRARHPAPGANEASRRRSRHPAPVRGTPGFPSFFFPALSPCFHAPVEGSRLLPFRSAAGRPASLRDHHSTLLSPHVSAFGQRRGLHDHQLDRRGRRRARFLDPCMLHWARPPPSTILNCHGGYLRKHVGGRVFVKQSNGSWVYESSEDNMQAKMATFPVTSCSASFPEFGYLHSKKSAGDLTLLILSHRLLKENIISINPISLRGHHLHISDTSISNLVGSCSLNLVGAFNGFLCFSSFDHECVLVCNPITIELVILPKPGTTLPPEPLRMVYGFGFDSTSETYKVVRVSYSEGSLHNDANLKVSAEVYNLGATGSWRAV
ncbi:hypothetical protein GW17_00031513 [Ensete ventricosum]|nr:hypothetical protein GW17_00031513 [Ensete ventricosum]